MIAALIALAAAQFTPLTDPPDNAWVLVGRACQQTDEGAVCRGFTSRDVFASKDECQAYAEAVLPDLIARLEEQLPGGGRLDLVCVTLGEYVAMQRGG